MDIQLFSSMAYPRLYDYVPFGRSCEALFHVCFPQNLDTTPPYTATLCQDEIARLSLLHAGSIVGIVYMFKVGLLFGLLVPSVVSIGLLVYDLYMAFQNDDDSFYRESLPTATLRDLAHYPALFVNNDSFRSAVLVRASLDWQTLGQNAKNSLCNLLGLAVLQPNATVEDFYAALLCIRNSATTTSWWPLFSSLGAQGKNPVTNNQKLFDALASLDPARHAFSIFQGMTMFQPLTSRPSYLTQAIQRHPNYLFEFFQAVPEGNYVSTVLQNLEKNAPETLGWAMAYLLTKRAEKDQGLFNQITSILSRNLNQNRINLMERAIASDAWKALGLSDERQQEVADNLAGCKGILSYHRTN